MNEYRFSKYREAKDSDDIKEIEAEVLNVLAQEKVDNKNREIDFPSSDEEDSDEAAYMESIREKIR